MAKMTQAERDALFGDEETQVETSPAPKKGNKATKAPKPEPKKASKPEPKKAEKPVKKASKPEPKKATKSAKEEAKEEHGRKLATDAKKYKSVGECKRRPTSVYGLLFEAFKGGAKVGDVIEELKMTYDAPRSKRYRGNERAYFMGTICTLVADGALVDA